MGSRRRLPEEGGWAFLTRVGPGILFRLGAFQRSLAWGRGAVLLPWAAVASATFGSPESHPEELTRSVPASPPTHQVQPRITRQRGLGRARELGSY